MNVASASGGVLGALRPVGEPLARLQLQPASPPRELAAPGYEAWFFRSGTAALAMAMRLAVSARPGARRVLLPAYACPDLVAAAHCAGAEPVLVDTAPGSPFVTAELAGQLMSAPGVAALVAAHFLGLRADMPALRALADRSGVALIEDAAQLCPAFVQRPPAGHFVVASFGRGKPLAAGGGGMLLAAPGTAGLDAYVWPPAAGRDAGVWPGVRGRMRRSLYNAAIGPLPFWLASRLPWLALGATRYRPLQELAPLPEFSARVLAATRVDAGLERSVAQDVYVHAFDELPAGWVNLPAALGGRDTSSALLRYPLLAPSQRERDEVVATLGRMGVTSFYGRALHDLPGLPAVECLGTDEARRFAARLLTLPVHSGVSRSQAATIAAAITRARAGGSSVRSQDAASTSR